MASGAPGGAAPGAAPDPSPIDPAHRIRAIPPGRFLGVLGGGQLGRMFVHAAQTQGHRVAVLDPDPASPAGAAADRHLIAAFDDPLALDEMATLCAAVTTEFENVPAASLELLSQRVPVSPPAASVAIAQDRALEKACFARAGLACAPHRLIASDDDVQRLQRDRACAGVLPGILKTARLGYDGKGQMRVDDGPALQIAWSLLGPSPCVLERRLTLQRELSVIVARDRSGHAVHLPLQQNLHRDGILAVTQVPAPDIAASTAALAIEQALTLASVLDYIGVLCVEFFVLDDGSLVTNEIAPRPHNSGHYSIDACDVSQFDLQWRVLAGVPLVQPRQHSAAVMLNLLGDLWFAEPPRAEPARPTEPDWPAVLALPGANLHLYGKSAARPGRKMGHLTVTAADPAEARQTAQRAAALLGLPIF